VHMIIRNLVLFNPPTNQRMPSPGHTQRSHSRWGNLQDHNGHVREEC
jgi:hypothetical protein